MMGTHVRVTNLETGAEHVLPTPRSLRKDSKGCWFLQESRNPMGQPTEVGFLISEADHNRLAALLVGEGEAGPLRGPLEDAIAWLERESRRAYEAADRHAGGGKDSDHVRGLLITRGELHKTIADRLRHFSTPPAPPDLPAPSVSMHPVDCLACGKRFASLSNANGQWCLACIEKRAADSRTPGQVAYEACRVAGLVEKPWEHLPPSARACWEEVAAAVMALGRGER